ncbi:MAG: hypothetical protein GC146_04535 [Limimaricola sp.]|uniref:hypothetical protein n=1 Tax=Limimaricola sp. TaxID=2211665 RepID=UPI001D1D0374|nr:hypothetical protein [Limimaricola sp.]MBI1416471.1 hypothetical protein [Limimaricola sp.]
MISRSPKSEAARNLDPALVGEWTTGGRTYAFAADGWYQVYDDALATVSADGQSLDIAGTVYDRVLGAGGQIVGEWSLTTLDGGVTWVEDWLLRADGTYAVQWTADGAFDSVYLGSYSYRGGILATRERRALVSTGPGDAILFDVPYGPDSTGTYSILPGGELLVIIDGVTTTYTPA